VATLAVSLGLFLLFNRRPPLRLSPYMVESTQKQRGRLIDLKDYGGDCAEGGFETYLERARAAEVSADTLACLSRFAGTATVQAYLTGLQLEEGDARQRVAARRNALSLMVGMGAPAVDELCRSLGEGRDPVRSLSASALALMASDRSSACLEEASSSGDPAVRLAVASVLGPLIAVGQLPAPHALALVSRMAADPEPPVRAVAVWAYAMFVYDHAVPAVERLSRDPDPSVQQAAQSALRQLKTVRMMDLGR